MNGREEAEKKVQRAIREEWPNISVPEIIIEHPKNSIYGDDSTSVSASVAKIVKEDPYDVAQKIKQRIQSYEVSFIRETTVARPVFNNFSYSNNSFIENLKTIDGNIEFTNKKLKDQKIIIEHTQPNPFKLFHIGHLMNNAIGESVSRIIQVNGATVKTASYHGDVGLHVAKSIWGLRELLKQINDKLKERWGLFFPIAKILDTLKIINRNKLEYNFEFAYSYGSKHYELSESAKQEIQEINIKIYDRSDKEINELYDWGKQFSISEFNKMYQKLGSTFDYHFYESQAGDVGKKLVLGGLEKGIFIKGLSEKADGKEPIVFPGEQYGLHTRVFLNSDGLPTYEGKEVGLVQLKREKFEFNYSVTVTANEQDSFFDVTEIAIGEIFPNLKGKLKHLSHGILKLPEGKMSSRTGNVVTAESLIEKVKEMVRQKAIDKVLNDATIEQIAIGAIKYSVLKQSIGSDIIFDFEKSISFEGDSGPYLQYSYVRAISVLAKAKVEKVKLSFENLPAEVGQLEKMMTRFSEVVEEAGKIYEPHLLVTYLTKLAHEFNNYYAQNKIVDKADEFSPYKVALTQAFTQIMKNGLWLLGIGAPEKM